MCVCVCRLNPEYPENIKCNYIDDDSRPDKLAEWLHCRRWHFELWDMRAAWLHAPSISHHAVPAVSQALKSLHLSFIIFAEAGRDLTGIELSDVCCFFSEGKMESRQTQEKMNWEAAEKCLVKTLEKWFCATLNQTSVEIHHSSGTKSLISHEMHTLAKI